MQRWGPWDAARSSLKSQERRELRLQEHYLWPTILPVGSAYNMAEPSNKGRDLRAKIEYRTVTTVV